MSNPEQGQVVVDATPSRKKWSQLKSNFAVRIGGTALIVTALAGGITEGVHALIEASDAAYQSDLRDDANTIAHDTAVVRFEHDYTATVSNKLRTHAGQDCLLGTGYDPNLRDTGAGGVVSAGPGDEIVVTAFGNEATALIFKDPAGDATHNLAPASTETAQTLRDNGCSPGTTYGSIN